MIVHASRSHAIDRKIYLCNIKVITRAMILIIGIKRRIVIDLHGSHAMGI